MPQRPQLVGQTNLGFEIFQIVDGEAVELLHHHAQPCFFHKGARGDDVADVGRGASGAQPFGASRVIQQGRHAAAHRQAQNQAQRGRGIGGEHAHDFVSRRFALNHARKRQRHLEQRAVGVFHQADVFHQLVVAAKGLFAVQKGLEQRALRTGGNQHI